MNLTQVDTTSTVAECTSTSIAGKKQVEENFKLVETRRDLKARQYSLYDQLFDGLSLLEYDVEEVEVVLALLEELGTAVHTSNKEYMDSRGIFSIRMSLIRMWRSGCASAERAAFWKWTGWNREPKRDMSML